MLKNHDKENIVEHIHAYTSPHRPMPKRSLHVISEVTTTDDRQTFTVPTLIDSGCTNSGDRAQFAEWWIKLQIWVKANWDAFADDFEVATAVLSRLKGPVAGRYAQVRLQECYTAGVWPTWDDLKKEIKKYFKPQAERDWARQQICLFKQGHMSRDCRKGAQAAQQKNNNNQGRQARQLETEKPDNRLNSLAGHFYDEIRAFFYDQQVNEMKAQGKAFGA
ncbi:hypothetical protein SERLA73DRAFT_77277 [Serpula lacrymans var. lacrymans S7.3]|uniref:Retrotransposon gag domain-containing protein n=2 Tax=Serpula lacrymans var. lacrymans TaxID=341189 RepID=F8Q9L1_SERL3|nr:uncharacterized protein SERLADRAFT_442144 [Serpula lacrymans var. lacrymans S7.9]EGN95266.1 hypothetical protein SERLA73DRAFT_77277 [Serpula lacrymans var. lacrymans S7.3]EGO20793.1 hypothetical protein SERLADRAFT_442144 [Serpula lacrymans var. lacrymans S7.9]